MALDGLNYKTRMFVAYYLGDAAGNATAAARLVGYKQPHVAGCRLLKNVKVKAAIKAGLDRAGLRAEEVLARLSDLATGTIGDFGDIDQLGFRLNLLKAKRRGKLHCVKRIKPHRVRVEDDADDGDGKPRFVTEYELEMYDSLSALDKLAKVHGLYKDGSEPVTVVIQRKARRLDRPDDAGSDSDADAPPDARTDG